MAPYNYERLTGLDNSFLVFEEANHNAPMHVASVAIFEGEPLTRRGGGIDFDRIAHHVSAILHKIPRYRQRLAYIPVERHPVWVDDERFNLLYHLRHTSLPFPGDIRQLKRLSARIMSQQLDRGKPLWEAWVVEGLQGGRIALIQKIHHCMIDGVSGADLMEVLLSASATPPRDEVVRWIPRPVPSATTLLRDEVVRRVSAPLHLAGRLLTEPGRVVNDVRTGLEAVSDMVGKGMRMASDSPFNQPIGPHRRFDWTSHDIAAIKEIRARLGGSLNDVVLTTVAGAVRRFLERRSVSVRGMDFRVFVPVSTRNHDEKGSLGNRVAAWMLDLPIADRDPQRRLKKIQSITADAKSSSQARGAELLTEMYEWTSTTALSLTMRLGTWAHPVNLVVTNVPGPPQPLYLLGARMLEVYPMVPLGMDMALGIALFSNAGKIFWGFNADWDLFPDLHDFVDAIEASFEGLQQAAARSIPSIGQQPRSRTSAKKTDRRRAAARAR